MKEQVCQGVKCTGTGMSGVENVKEHVCQGVKCEGTSLSGGEV